VDRRRFLQTSLAGAFAAPLRAWAQQEGKVWRIGLFHVGLDHVPPSLEGLRHALRELGYAEGRNIRLDFHNLPDEAAAQATARRFVRDRVDLIVAFENQTVRAAQGATRQIPIVFLDVSDPVADGFVKSLAQPGGNLTGFSEFFGDLHAKKVEIFTQVMPRPNRLLVMTASDDPMSQRGLEETRRAARSLNVELLESEVTDQRSVESVFSRLRQGEANGVLIVSSTLVTKFPSLILRLATARRLPVALHRKEWVGRGALFSYGANFETVGHDAARYVDQILKGTAPASLPVEQVSRLELVINLKTAKALGLTIPPSLLARADQVIE
jgi:putative tryptophan/tyrosine transport system substrate-binding protein